MEEKQKINQEAEHDESKTIADNDHNEDVCGACGGCSFESDGEKQ